MSTSHLVSGETYDRLDPKVRARARYLAHALDADPDDVTQEMWFGIMVKARRDPQFLQQTDAYVVRAGELHARNQVRKAHSKEATERRRLGHRIESLEADEPDPLEEARAADDTEDTAIANILLDSLLATLPPRAACLVQALARGHTRKEVSLALGRDASWATKTVTRQVAPAWARLCE